MRLATAIRVPGLIVSFRLHLIAIFALTCFPFMLMCLTAPEMVRDHEREFTGVAMALLLLVGLLLGSMFSNVLAIFIPQ